MFVDFKTSIDVLKELRDNTIRKRVPGLDHPIQEEVVSYCCPRAETIPFFELIDSLRILRFFPRINSAGPDISKFFLRSSGFTQLIFSLLLITLYISIKSPLSRLSFKLVKHNLFYLSSYTYFSKPNGILVALL